MSNLTDFIRFRITQKGASLEAAEFAAAELAGEEAARIAVAEVRSQIERIKTLPDPFYIAESNRLDWYTGPADDDAFWPAYLSSLRSQGWIEDDIASLDRASSRVLQLMLPPGLPSIRTRGLVVGYVQSGKTANYAATIAKAADVGYRLIVVLAGGTNVLRRQTQDRLVRDLVANKVERWVMLTDSERDFGGGGNAAAFLSNATGQCTIAVIKKHKMRINRLTAWLKSAGQGVLSSCSVLVVDDEADQASPNSAAADDVRTRINEALVEMLRAAPKIAYVGYTATPFANLLIDPTNPEDLYPRDFIVDLPKPTTYFGPEKIFGREPLTPEEAESQLGGLDMVRHVPVDEVGDALVALNTGKASALTPTLRTALRYFLLVTAERYRRGQDNKHSSMLVHTSQRIAAHWHVVKLIDQEFGLLRDALKARDTEVLANLRSIWELESGKVEDAEETAGSFDELIPHFGAVLKKAMGLVENSNSERRLDYSVPGQIVVVVGGNVLARGLTLEGLSVSYFVRSASAYDSLMQMGRWFGYRRGYADLPRIWMTLELSEYFFDLGTVEAEMRKEIARYEHDRSITPLKVGVRIRTHPKLSVTAKSKMRAAVYAAMSFRGRRIQTTLFNVADNEVLSQNIAAAEKLLISARESSDFSWIKEASAWLARDAKPDDVISFLESYVVLPHGEFERGDLIRQYVRNQADRGTVPFWNIAVASRGKDDYGDMSLGPISNLRLIRRTRALTRVSEIGVPIGALMSERDAAIDVATELPGDGASIDFLSERNRRAGNRGLLIVYPIAGNAKPQERESRTRSPLGAKQPVIGVALVFPDVEDGAALAYLTADLSRVPQEQVNSFAELGADPDEDLTA